MDQCGIFILHCMVMTTAEHERRYRWRTCFARSLSCRGYFSYEVANRWTILVRRLLSPGAFVLHVLAFPMSPLGKESSAAGGIVLP